ncbi:aspartate dehydrogenase [Pusillimonas sp. SM2304]|uniref:aspartate dehydrogenase n=1 Tax=Pusillimonas sp. SM2304 TaxID=3073241 RepID=UPI0028753C2D|nr:aspartate dehydrogenase [Pusillimonas sp. SM2304]MDS1138970.1 aspartate dehydrogenase [Pusillimonas sp. SM2304]
MTQLRIGMIGCGTIGMEVQRMLAVADWADVVGILVRANGKTIANPQAVAAPLHTSLDALLASRPELVVECSGHEAVDAYAEHLLNAGCDVMILSVGALASAERHDRLKAAALSNKRRIIIPAGAIGGLDFLQAARSAGLTSVRYRSCKPPMSWRGSPAEKALDLATLSEASVFYQGSARMAAIGFPKNANVAATLALATLGLDETQVEMMADPQADGNYHEIEAVSMAGSISVRIKAMASPDNPSTSLITAHSVIHALQRECAALVI